MNIVIIYSQLCNNSVSNPGVMFIKTVQKYVCLCTEIK